MAVSTRALSSSRADATIPVIDFGPCFSGVPGALETTAAQFRAAFENIGFLVMVNHGPAHERAQQRLYEHGPIRGVDVGASHAFEASFAEGQFTFRLSHYPPVTAEPNQFGHRPPHRRELPDVPRPEGGAGLAGAHPAGQWLDVPSVPGSYAVNAGDMMHRWTNGRFKSTPHRALPPVGQPRYAIPFFLGPHIDTVIECLHTCQGPGNPPRFPPITYEAYLTWWYDANYKASAQTDDTKALREVRQESQTTPDILE